VQKSVAQPECAVSQRVKFQAELRGQPLAIVYARQLVALVVGKQQRALIGLPGL
jgi:hypothetical protein